MVDYIIGNYPMATTAAPSPVATGTVAKTMLQVTAGANRYLHVIGWGCSFQAAALATPGVVELVHTGTVAATVTAHVAAGVQPYSDVNSNASLVVLGTGATGFTASAEGTVTTSRSLDTQQVDPANSYNWLFLPDRRPEIPPNGVLRVRMTFGTSVPALCYVIIDE